MVEKFYNVALRQFFRKEWSNREFNGNDPDSPHLFNALAIMFSDVSYHANRYVPIAVPLTAEACCNARKRLKQIRWFRKSVVPESFAFDFNISVYDGK